MVLKTSGEKRSSAIAGSTCRLTPAAIAKAIVAAAQATDLRSEPILKLSPINRIYGFIQSVVCRHGMMLQQMLSDGVARDERFEILRDHPVPVCIAALECVTSRTRPQALKSVTLSASGAVHHVATVDQFVVNLERGWAGVFDCKRGHSPTPAPKRRTIETDLRAMKMILPSFARQLGFLQVDVATGGVIDFYGNAGFRDDISIPKNTVDALFEMPLVGKIDQMTAALERELANAVAQMLTSSNGARPDDAERERVNDKVISLFRGRPADGSGVLGGE